MNKMNQFLLPENRPEKGSYTVGHMASLCSFRVHLHGAKANAKAIEFPDDFLANPIFCSYRAVAKIKRNFAFGQYKWALEINPNDMNHTVSSQSLQLSPSGNESFCCVHFGLTTFKW